MSSSIHGNKLHEKLKIYVATYIVSYIIVTQANKCWDGFNFMAIVKVFASHVIY